MMALAAFALPIRGAASSHRGQSDQFIAAANIVSSAAEGSPAKPLSVQANSPGFFSAGTHVKGAVPRRAINTGFRGHEVIADASRPGHWIFFPRRPGTQGLLLHGLDKKIVARFDAKPGHHFLGHGFVDLENNRLYTCESNFDSGEGKIGIRALDTLKQVGAFPSYGVGPHQIKLMPGHNAIVVANGGLQTHPSRGRDVLNLATMDSRVTYVEKNTGALLGHQKVAEPKASIRHLDAVGDWVAVAMQVQRGACNHQRAVPLLAIQKNALGENAKPKVSGPLVEVSTPEAILEKLHDYLGNVVIHAAAGIVAATSPRGNLAVFWRLDTGEFLHYHRFYDACGLAISTDKQHFVLTNSVGEMRFIRANSLQEDKNLRRTFPGVVFDNHLSIQSVYL